MRVAFLVGPYPKPSKTFIEDQIVGLAGKGVNLEVFAEPPGTRGIRSREFAGNNPDLKVIYSDWTNYSTTLQRMAALPGLLLSSPGPVFSTFLRSLNFFKHRKRAFYLESFFDTLPYLSDGKYDIIHAHFGNYGILAQDLREMGLLKGKLVTSFHGNDLSAYKLTHRPRSYRRLLSRGDLFLPVSRFWKERLVRMGCRSDKISVHHMGVDCRRFQFRRYTPSGDEKIRIISIGRLTEKKGFKFGILACSELIKNGVNLVYDIIGDGPERQELSALISGLNLQGTCNLLGWKERSEVIEILETSFLLLCPSVTALDGDMEGIPMVLMEAMAMGVPVVSTFHSGIPELVRDNETGLLAEEGDPKSLFIKMASLIADPEKRLSLIENARQTVERHFNLEKQNEKLIEHYEKLLS